MADAAAELGAHWTWDVSTHGAFQDPKSLDGRVICETTSRPMCETTSQLDSLDGRIINKQNWNHQPVDPWIFSDAFWTVTFDTLNALPSLSGPSLEVHDGSNWRGRIQGLNLSPGNNLFFVSGTDQVWQMYNRRAISKTLGSRKGHPQIWEVPLLTTRLYNNGIW